MWEKAKEIQGRLGSGRAGRGKKGVDNVFYGTVSLKPAGINKLGHF